MAKSDARHGPRKSKADAEAKGVYRPISDASSVKFAESHDSIDLAVYDEMMVGMVMAPPRRLYDPYKIPLRLALILFVVSLALHISLSLLSWPMARESLRNDSPAPLMTFNLEPKAEIVETLQETAKEKPKNARFESSRNLEADEDTSAESGSSVVGKRGERVKSAAPASIPQNKVQAKSSAPPRAESSDAKKILTMSSDDLARESQPQEQTRESGLGDRFDSAGFNERLKKARELKTSAMESDRGQFITRMQRKIAQHWSPLKTVNSGMYNYDAVTVEIAVILNRAGELVKLVVTDASLFADYDSETLRALKEAAPYPNPPKTLIGSDGLVIVPWQFTLYLRRALFAVE